ncbi:MAG: hypothetical protein HN348_31490, partial [Proteobacteria bacterium]|nr:hypothetical protein [Pseudomonadota bacterium]
MAYVLDQLRGHRVVALGEDHWIRNQVVFVVDVIETALNEDLIDVVAIEFGTSDKQPLADRIVGEEEFHEEWVHEIFRDMSDFVGWGYE